MLNAIFYRIKHDTGPLTVTLAMFNGKRKLMYALDIAKTDTARITKI